MKRTNTVNIVTIAAREEMAAPKKQSNKIWTSSVTLFRYFRFQPYPISNCFSIILPEQ